MNLNNLEKHIDNKILERGIDYYEIGCVIDLVELKNGKWSAKVEGTEVYNVTVEIENKEITGSFCDCPYDMGPVCKHEVAVYFELKDMINGEKPDKRSVETRDSKLKKLLDGHDADELKKVIIDKAIDDEKFYNYLTLCFSKNDQKESRGYYKKYIKSSLNAISGRHGFIDYYRAGDAADLGFELLDDARKLLGRKQYEGAMNIAQAVIEVFVPSLGYTDDSAGGQGMVIEDAFEILFDAAENDLPDELKKKTFEYYLKQSNKNVYDDYGSWQDLFIELALLASTSEKEINRLLESVEKIIEDESKGESFSRYKLEKYCMIKYHLLLKLNDSDQAESFFETCIKFPDFRRMRFEKLLKKKDYKGIVDLAFDGEENDEQYAGLVHEWKEWRLKAYEKMKDSENIEKLSLEMIVEWNELKYYEIYKKICKNKNWDKKYKALKKKLNDDGMNGFNNILADILVKEKEFPELLEILKKNPFYVESYQKHFLKTHPEEIYSLHMVNIREEARKSDNRKRYKSVCQSIRKLMKIGGIEEGKVLINEFKKNFYRRPAFLDELSKLKP